MVFWGVVIYLVGFCGLLAFQIVEDYRGSCVHPRTTIFISIFWPLTLTIAFFMILFGFEQG